MKYRSEACGVHVAGPVIAHMCRDKGQATMATIKIRTRSTCSKDKDKDAVDLDLPLFAHPLDSILVEFYVVSRPTETTFSCLFRLCYNKFFFVLYLLKGTPVHKL